MLVQVLDEDLVKSDLVSLMKSFITLRLVKSRLRYHHYVLMEEWMSGSNFNIRAKTLGSCISNQFGIRQLLKTSL